MFGVDAGIIGGVLAMPGFKRYVYLCRSSYTKANWRVLIIQTLSEFGLDKLPASAAANLSGNLVTTMQAGAIAGALVSSPLADRQGRKFSLLAVAVTGIIGGLMQGLSYGHLPVFYIGR